MHWTNRGPGIFERGESDVTVNDLLARLVPFNAYDPDAPSLLNRKLSRTQAHRVLVQTLESIQDEDGETGLEALWWPRKRIVQAVRREFPGAMED